MDKSIFQSSLSPFQKINFETESKRAKNKSKPKSKRKPTEPLAVSFHPDKTLDLLIQLQNFDDSNGTSLFQTLTFNQLQHFLNGTTNYLYSNLFQTFPKK